MLNWIETAASRVKSRSPFLIFRIRQGFELFFIEWQCRVEYFIGFDLKKVPFIAEKSIAPELIPLKIRGLLPETKGLTHHAGTFRHGVIVDDNIERIDEIGETSGVLGLHILPLFKKKHFLIKFLDEQFELILITRFTLIKLDQSFFKGDHQCLD